MTVDGAAPSRLELTEATNDLQLQTATFTIEFWAFLGAENERATLIKRGPVPGAANDGGWQLDLRNDRIQGGIFSRTGLTASLATEPGWHHLAFVLDGMRLSVFRNGNPVAPTDCDVGTIDGNSCSYSTDIQPLPTERAAFFGASANGDGIPQTFRPGGVDEIRISSVARYSSAFTPSRRFDSDASTLLLLHFDEGSGGIVEDDSGNGHSLAGVGGFSWSPDDGYGGIFCD